MFAFRPRFSRHYVSRYLVTRRILAMDFFGISLELAGQKIKKFKLSFTAHAAYLRVQLALTKRLHHAGTQENNAITNHARYKGLTCSSTQAADQPLLSMLAKT